MVLTFVCNRIIIELEQKCIYAIKRDDQNTDNRRRIGI